MKAEMIEGFQESEIRKVCVEGGQGSAKNILVSQMEKGERKFILKKKDQ